MEGLRQVDPALHLLAGVRRPRAAVVEGIARHQRHRPAVEPGEPGDDRTAVQRADLEERSAIHDAFDDRAHLVDLPGVARHDVAQPRLAALGVVGLGPPRGQVVDRGRQIGEEAARAGEGVLLRVDGAVHRARPELDPPPAQLVLGELLAEARDDRGSGDEEGGLVLDHDRVVRGGQVRGAEPGHRPEPERHPRDRPHVGHDPFPARHAGDVGAPRGLDGLHRAAAAGTLD